MHYIANLDSGNYVLRIFDILANKGYVFEVVSTPCKIAKGGCAYSLKFPAEYLDIVEETAIMNGIRIKEIYEIITG